MDETLERFICYFFEVKNNIRLENFQPFFVLNWKISYNKRSYSHTLFFEKCYNIGSYDLESV